MENVVWTILLVLMPRALRNFQRKIEDGHCRNTTHEHGTAEPRNCEIGRQFHRDMLNKCLQSYRDIINAFDPTRPQKAVPTTDNPIPELLVRE